MPVSSMNVLSMIHGLLLLDRPRRREAALRHSI
jgi:hypothetical protein